MNINIDDNKGQQKVVTRNRLQEYVNWLNQTNGGSYLRVSSSSTFNAITLTITSMLADANGGIAPEGSTGIGTVHWERTDSGSTPASTSATGSITITGTDRLLFPMGKFWLEYGDKKYTELDNSISIGNKIPSGGGIHSKTGDTVNLPIMNFSGYTQMSFNETSGNTDPKYCVTYDDLINSTYTRYFNSTTMTDGLVVNSYSINNGDSNYSGNQLVAEKDVNYGKLTHNLEISHITLEIDAMTDIEEYRNGYIPYANSEIKFVDVKDVKYDSDGDVTSSESVTDFTLSKALTDNSDTAKKDYTGVTLSKDSSVAKAAINGNNYQVTVYYYSDEFTLTSTTISTPIGSAKTTSISGSTALGTGTQRRINVSISTTGALTFDIKQRGEVYGYFPVDVYRNSINANGNVEMSAIDDFIIGASTSTTANSFENVDTLSIGWLDNAGDNFGESSLSSSKVKLSASDVSVYDGYNGNNGRDVYNSNATVYERGSNVSERYTTYHMAWANDAYNGNTGKTDNLLDTKHLYCLSGTMTKEAPTYSCTENYLNYTYNAFDSEYKYVVKYNRTYRKLMHQYGRTSIVRRFRKINDVWTDSANDSFSAYNVSGTSFPKHVRTKELEYSIVTDWSDVNSLYAGQNKVSGWTSIIEYKLPVETPTSIPAGSWVDYTTYRSGLSYSITNGFISVPENNSAEYVYNYIAPYFYMVDPERCIPSADKTYDFTITSSITENSTNVVNNYALDDSGYFVRKSSTNSGYTNYQDAYRPYIAYNRHDASQVKSYRYGSKVSSSSCTPHAPLETVYWVDTYASSSAKIGQRSVLFENEYNDGVTTPTNRLIPMTNTWSNSNDHNTRLSDINNFEYPYIFAGDGNYKYNHYNQSSHSKETSLNFVEGTSYNANMKLGATIASSSPTYSAPQHAVVLDSNNIITSYEYYNLAGNSAKVSTSNTNSYKFVEVEEPQYSDGYLRPCKGDFTMPFWSGKIKFAINQNNISSTSNNNRIRVKINGTELTNTPQKIGNTYCKIVNNNAESVRADSDFKQNGEFVSTLIVLPILEAGSHYGQTVETNTDLYTYTLAFLAYECYETGLTMSVELYNGVTGEYTHELSWKIDTRKDYKIGLSSASTISETNGWANFSGNNDTVLFTTKSESDGWPSTVCPMNLVNSSVFTDFGGAVNQSTLNARNDDNSENTFSNAYW